MKQFLSERRALVLVAAVLSLIIVFHGLVMAGVIPQDIVWGGRISSREQMLRLETISVLVNLLLLAVVGIKAGLFGRRIPQRVVTAALWAMTVLFFLNTIGNLLSQNEVEKMIFTPLTGVLFLLCLRLSIGKGRQPAVGK